MELTTLLRYVDFNFSCTSSLSSDCLNFTVKVRLGFGFRNSTEPVLSICNFAGYWHSLLSEEDSMLFHGGVFQHLRCVSFQRIHGVDGGESRMEAGKIFHEEAVPGGVGESHAGTPHSTTPTPSPNASLCRINERDTRPRSKITCERER